MPLAARLRQAIEEAGISQRELARRIAGADSDPRRIENERRQLQKYLEGKHSPAPERAALLAELLDKPADYFIDPAAAPTRVIDQVRDLVTKIDELRAFAEERLPEEAAAAGPLGALLAALAMTVDRQGKEMTKALRAVARRLEEVEDGLARLEPPQDQPSRRANH